MLRFMIRTSLMLLAGLPILIAPVGARGQEASVLLHARPYHSGICTPESQGGAAPTDLPCPNYDTSGEIGHGTLIYLVAHTAVEHGVVGLSCGIDYSGTTSGIPSEYVTYTACNDGLIFPSSGWPAPGSGNRITWATCQDTDVGGTGVNAIAGAFYVYAYGMDTFKATENNSFSTPELAIVDCNGVYINMDPETDTGSVVFSSDGSIEGTNPCSGTVVPDDPIALLQALIAEVMGLNLDSGVDNSLDAKLDVALGALEDMNAGNDGSAVNLIESFINEVQAQAGNQIPQADADNLVAQANHILQLLNQASSMAAGMQGVPVSPSILASPNPFRSDTRIRFTLVRGGDVVVDIFDVQGRKVAELFQGPLPAGQHDLAWDGRTASGDLASPGVYLARVRAGDTRLNARLIRLD